MADLVQLQRSRKRLRPGDIFVYSFDGKSFWFGRVVRTDVTLDVFRGLILVYLYRANSTAPEDVPKLDCHDLLVPPVVTNRLGWSRGAFETVRHGPLREDDVLEVHCFRHPLNRRCVDEYGTPLVEPTDSCGDLAVSSYQAIAQQAAQAIRGQRLP